MGAAIENYFSGKQKKYCGLNVERAVESVERDVENNGNSLVNC